MKRLVVAFVSLAACAAGLSAQAPAPAAAPARGRATTPAPAASTARQGRAAAPAKPLDIYVLDVEGGKSTIFVTPSGQIVMIDTGNPGARDLDRITGALDSLGIKKIDYLITTHYHVDHIGGMLELAKKVQIDHFIDHGPTVEQGGQAAFHAGYADLKAKAKYTQAKPGDKLPITGLDWRIVSSAGEVIKTPLPGGGKANPECATYVPKAPDAPDGGKENGQSVGSVITYGQFRAIDVGDLLWNIEGQLACPINQIGTVDVYFTTHHGLDYSGSAAFVHGIHPRATVMQNGPRKGGAASAIQIIRTSPGMEDLWQLHWGDEAGLEYNSAGMFIANVDDAATTAAVLTAPPPARGGRGGPGAPGGPGGAPGAGAPGARGGAGAPPAAPGAAPQPDNAQRGGQPPVVGGQTAPPAGAAPGAPGAPGAGGPGGPGGAGGGRGGGANQLQNPAHTPAYYIKVSAMPDGSFTITNQRNGFSKTYSKK